MLNSKATDLRAQLITTEKDLVRLTASQKTNITALPIEIEFEDIKQIKYIINFSIKKQRIDISRHSAIQ